MYCLPQGGTVTSILKIDTNTNIATEFGSIVDKYISCGVASNGFIYGFGFVTGAFLKINIATDALTTFGVQGDTISSTRTFEYNGFMYGFGGTTISKVNISTDAVSVITYASIGFVAGFLDSTLAQNGRFYFPPGSNGDLWSYNPATNTATNEGFIEAAPQWGPVGISSTGIMYAVPDITNEILELTINNISGVPSKYFPIVITTEESTLEDKFSPETLFRVKFRLANRRKGIK